MTEFESMNKALKASWVRSFNTDINEPRKIIIIVENKFQPPINEKSIFSHGVNDSDMHKIYNWLFFN